MARRGGIAAAGTTVVLLVGFNAVALRVVAHAEIEDAGINIVSVLEQNLIPHPCYYVAVIAVIEHGRHATLKRRDAL